MADPDILEAFTDFRTGVEFECVRTPDNRILWGAWHPAYMGKPCMAVGSSQGTALNRLLAKEPRIAGRLAA